MNKKEFSVDIEEVKEKTKNIFQTTLQCVKTEKTGFLLGLGLATLVMGPLPAGFAAVITGLIVVGIGVFIATQK